MDDGPSTDDVARVRRFAEHYARKTGTALHPDTRDGPRVGPIDRAVARRLEELVSKNWFQVCLQQGI
jgi:hypothetical protein